MASEQIHIKEIEMLIENEEGVANLYKAYGKKFPKYQSFWLDMAKDETEHADNIRNLYSKIKNGSAYFKEGRFKKEAIGIFSNYLQRSILELKTQEVSLKNALSISLDLENATIESSYSDVFEGDSAELKHTLATLLADEKKHHSKIKDALAQVISLSP